MTSTDIALPDLSQNPDFNYGASQDVATSGQSQWSVAGILGNVQSAASIYNGIMSTVSPKNGATVAQPTTLPSPQSPAGNISQLPPSVGTHAGFIDKLVAKFGVSVGVVWGAIVLGVAVALYIIHKWIK